MTPAQRYLHRLCDHVALVYQLDTTRLLTSSATGPIEARRVLFCVARDTLGLGIKATAEAIGCDRQLVRHHLRAAATPKVRTFGFSSVVNKVTKFVMRDFPTFGNLPAEAAE